MLSSLRLATLTKTFRSPYVLRAMSTMTSTFDPSSIQINLTNQPKTKTPKEELTFGTTFSDHMLEIDWTEEKGWGTPIIKPYANLEISPAATGLHYGIQCFEGMKCYRSAGSSSTPGKLRLFRPDCNMERMNNSMGRLAMPSFDSKDLEKCIKALCKVDESWVPSGDGYALYLRPTAIGTHPFLGVDVSKQVKIFVIASPVGPYYRTGFAPVSLYCDHANVRAWPGGTGSYKVGGNYGPTIKPAKAAMAKGFNQILWMFGEEDEITECGAMNLFFLWTNDEGVKELITPPLSRGDILPGVTRRSILHLAETWGEFKVTEKFVSMKDIAKAGKDGRLHEAFGAGTAAVVSPIERINYKGEDINIQATGDVTNRVWKELNDIYYGVNEGPEGWSVLVEE